MSTVFWGAAGTATVQLTIPREKDEITMKTLEGCLVKKDANLSNFVKRNLKDQSADRNKLKRSEYLFYAPDSDFEGNVTEATLTYPEISRTWGEYRQRMKECIVEEPLIIRVHGHLFLCCDSQLNRNNFLDEHCKVVRISQSLDCDKKFCGLGSERNGQLVFTSFGMSQCQSSNGLYKIKECSDYEKLKDAGPLLLDDNKTAVGCFRKTSDCRISVSIFGRNQGDSSSDQPPTPPPDDSSSDQPPTPSPGGSSSGQTPAPPPDGSSSGQTPSPCPVCLKVLFQKDAGILQALGRQYLDRRAMVIKNHENLADLLKAPPSIKAKCKSNTEHSPTLDLLQLSRVSKRSVNELVIKLKEMTRKDVAEIIEAEIPENKRQQSIANALNGHAEVFEEKVASELDKNGMFNWQKLGVKLEISKDELNQIKMGCNPAKQFLEDYAYPTLEQEKLTVECFRQHITTMGRHDILDLLDKFGITQQDDGRSIKDVIKPDSEIMWELCLLLNKCVSGLKDWKTLAHLWGIKYEVYSEFKLATRVSPTKILLEDWLIAERPEFTANALCTLLGEIQRNDAKEFLENKLQEHFRSNVLKCVKIYAFNTSTEPIVVYRSHEAARTASMSGNAVDAPTPRPPVEGTENSPRQPATSNCSSQMAAGGNNDQAANMRQLPFQEVGELPGRTRENISLPRGSSRRNDQLKLPQGYERNQEIDKDDMKYRMHLLHIAENLTDANWKKLGRNLAIPPKDLEGIEADYERVKERAYQMLIKWTECTTTPPTLVTLIGALKQTKQQKLVDEISDIRDENIRPQLQGGTQVQDFHLQAIISDIKDDWMFIGRYLGLKESAIREIKENCKTLYERAYQMLIKWQNVNGNKATLEVLKLALQKVGRENVVRKLEGKKPKSPA